MTLAALALPLGGGGAPPVPAGTFVKGGIPAFHVHPEVYVVLVAAALGWWWVHTRVARTTGRQQLWFGLGFVVLGAFSVWPLHDLAEERLYSVHMAQHVAYTFIAPCLLLLGVPVDAWRWLAGKPVIGWFARNATKPFPALLAFNVVAGLSHLQVVVNTVTPSEPLHFLAHLVLFTSGLCFWAPVVNRVPELPRLRPGSKMLHLAANMFLAMPVVGALALTGQPLYAHYQGLPLLWVASPLEDQQVAAAIMWLVESTWTTVAGFMLFLHWWFEEQRNPETASIPDHIRRRPLATTAPGA